jgi:hypothetical protein
MIDIIFKNKFSLISKSIIFVGVMFLFILGLFFPACEPITPATKSSAPGIGSAFHSRHYQKAVVARPIPSVKAVSTRKI